jgi:hypothetical protein
MKELISTPLNFYDSLVVSKLLRPTQTVMATRSIGSVTRFYIHIMSSHEAIIQTSEDPIKDR